MVKYLYRLFYVLPAKKNRLFIILCLFIFTSVIEVFGIGIIGPFIAIASNPQTIYQYPWLDSAFKYSGLQLENQFISLIGLVVIVIFSVKSFLAWFTQSYTLRFSLNQQGILVSKLSKEYLEAPYIYHTNKNSAYLINSVLEVINGFASGILTPLLTFISNSIITFFLFSLLCMTNLLTIAALLIILLPLLLLFYLFKDLVQRWGMEVRDAKEEIIRVINHSLGGIKETQIIGCEAYFNNQISFQSQKLSKAVSNFFTFRILPRYVIEMMIILCVVGVISIFLFFNQNIDNLTSILGVFALASIRMIPAISNCSSGITTLRNNSYALCRLYTDLKELESFKSDNSLSQANPRQDKRASYEFMDKNNIFFNETITLDSLSYRYPNILENVISDISLSFRKGQSIALIGKSGAGKTTLVDIILGLLTPQKGDIKVDHRSIYSNLSAWKNLIGYIPQSIFLIDDTIEKNIAFGVPSHLIDKQRLHLSIQSAQLNEVIENLPKGIETLVGERGVLLSGGQRQRIGIARALYHEREILVLDEATAALDNETEKLVTNSIKSLSRKKTIIIIAHRLTTVKHCDCIYMLDRGSLVKSGSYQEVVLGDDA